MFDVRNTLFVLAAWGLVMSTGCASVVGQSRSMENGARDEGSGVQRGHASYYADRFTGRRTSSGEKYDPQALTAAHRTLPFGTIVEVTRPDGRSVQVRVNDRGPYGPHGRIIDLSRRAASAIGMIRDGVVEVSLRVVSEPSSDIARR